MPIVRLGYALRHCSESNTWHSAESHIGLRPTHMCDTLITIIARSCEYDTTECNVQVQYVYSMRTMETCLPYLIYRHTAEVY